VTGHGIGIKILLGLALAVSGCGQSAPESVPAVPVRVVTVEKASGDEGLRYSASVEPQAKVPLSFQAQARVKSLLLFESRGGKLREVQAGDFVEEGLILGRLDASEYQEKVTAARAQRAGAEAAQAAAESSFKRSATLYASESVTAPEYDRAKKNYESALAQVVGSAAQVQQAELALNDCMLKAPWDGVVIKRNVQIGQLVSPTVEAFELADVSSVKAVFGVPGGVLQQVEIGAPISLAADSFPGESFSGRVTAISPAADQRSRVFQIQVTIPNPQNKLKIGMIGSLVLPKTVERFPLVPLDSVVRHTEDSAGYAVYVVTEGNEGVISEIRKVEIGPVRGDWISIISGIRSGERVVTSGATRVVSGQPIRIIP
jgi:RND family efflux transporter MFP subunit